MEYAGFLLRRERLKRNWSQEGLCKGICTVSYLSKIEQGKAMPSFEVFNLLMQRMELHWFGEDSQAEAFLEDAYEALFSFDDRLPDMFANADRERYCYSSYGADYLLLEQFVRTTGRNPMESELESCLNARQLALQRVLQHRYSDAMHLCIRAFFTCLAGIDCYDQGNLTGAVELLNQAYWQASEEGCPRIMLHCKLYLGNCYSNKHDLESMQIHYRVARRLAMALKDTNAIASIDYNTAATQIEAGHYREAMSYFQKLENPRRMDLHKLAICCEKLGLEQEALDALNRTSNAPRDDWMPEDLECAMLEVVRLRLQNKNYRKDVHYGEVLLRCFNRCREELPSGYAIFHLPWVLEWYESSRQYKLALELLRNFPEAGSNMLSNR